MSSKDSEESLRAAQEAESRWSGAMQAAQRGDADAYQGLLSDSGHDSIATEILAAGPFYYAEAYHQQYLAKNPGGYCGLGGTGVSCPVGLGVGEPGSS